MVFFQVVQGRPLADGKALDYRVNGNKTVVDWITITGDNLFWHPIPMRNAVSNLLTVSHSLILIQMRVVIKFHFIHCMF